MGDWEMSPGLLTSKPGFDALNRQLQSPVSYPMQLWDSLVTKAEFPS